MRHRKTRYSRSFRLQNRILALVALTLWASTTPAQNVEGAKLEKIFSGGDVVFQMSGHDATGWASAQWRFRADGSLTGYLFSSAYTPGRKPNKGVDNGGWWVKGETLCVQWSQWDGGKEHCYGISGKESEYTASGNKGLLAGRFTVIQ